MAHETNTGSSPIVKGLMNDLRDVLPDDLWASLDTYTEQAEASSPKGDYKRARYCLHWAIKTAESPDNSHLADLAIYLKEKHAAWKDIWLGGEFGTLAKTGVGQPAHEVHDQKIGAGEEIELLWVEEAADVAKKVADKSGWDKVPWEQLLQEVLKID